jgi:hypothetical protein
MQRAPKPAYSGHSGDYRWAIWKHPGGIITSRVVGRMEVDYSKALERVVDDVLKKQAAYIAAHDWSGVPIFDTRCQKDLTAVGVRTLRQMLPSVIWTTSTIVKLAVTVANLPLRGKLALAKTEAEFAEATLKVTGQAVDTLVFPLAT